MSSIVLKKKKKKRVVKLLYDKPNYAAITKFEPPELFQTEQKLANKVVTDARKNVQPIKRYADFHNFTVNITSMTEQNFEQISELIRHEHNSGGATLKVSIKPFLLIERDKVDPTNELIIRFVPYYANTNLFDKQYILRKHQFEAFRQKVVDKNTYEGLSFSSTDSSDKIIGVFGCKIQLLVTTHLMKGGNGTPFQNILRFTLCYII